MKLTKQSGCSLFTLQAEVSIHFSLLKITTNDLQPPGSCRKCERAPFLLKRPSQYIQVSRNQDTVFRSLIMMELLCTYMLTGCVYMEPDIPLVIIIHN